MNNNFQEIAKEIAEDKELTERQKTDLLLTMVNQLSDKLEQSIALAEKLKGKK